VPDNAGGTARDITGLIFADLQRDYHNNVSVYNKVGDIDFKVNANLTIEDWITQSAMLRRAQILPDRVERCIEIAGDFAQMDAATVEPAVIVQCEPRNFGHRMGGT
jgi:hypothetical protein